MEILITALGCLAVFLIQLKIYRRKCFEKLSYHCYFSKSEAYEGEEIEFIEEIENFKRLPLPVFKTELTASAALFFADTHSAVTDVSRFVTSYFEVKGKSRVKRVWKVKCERRGVHKISSVIMVSTDIFGTESYSERPDVVLPEITVLPRQYAFDADRILSHTICGDMPVNNPPFADPFYANGLREYTGNEPLKFINHNASAHENRLMVNTYDASADSHVTVVLTFGRHDDTNEHNIRVCAYLMAYLAQKRIAAELLIAGETTVKIRNAALSQYLYALAETKAMPTETLPKKLKSNTFIITESKETAKKADCGIIFTGSIPMQENRNVICVPERSVNHEKN